MENKTYAFFNRAAICALVVATSLGGISVAHAKGYGPAVAKNSTGFDIKFASNGTPLANMSNTASGVAVGATVALPLSSAVIIQAAASGAITGAAAAGAWGAAAGALGGLALLALPTVAQWMAKNRISADAEGFSKILDGIECSVGPCYEYQGINNGVWYKSLEQAAQNSVGVKPECGYYGIYRKNYVSVTYPNTYFFQYAYCGPETVFPDPSSGTIVVREVPPVQSSSTMRITLPEAIAAMTASAPTAAEVQALIDLNFPPEVTLPNITGSPRAYLGNTVQMTSPNEKKTIESWANMDYTKPGKVGVQVETVTKIDTAAKTTTAVTVNPDGTTSTTTTLTPAQSVTTTVNSNGVTKTTVITNADGTTSTTGSPVTQAETDEQTPPEDPCVKNPNRIGCLEVDTPALEIPKENKSISYTAETPFGDGSCPVNLSRNMMTLNKSVTVWDWSKTCQLALPLRALVLALASFAAFLIIMPGKVET